VTYDVEPVIRLLATIALLLSVATPRSSLADSAPVAPVKTDSDTPVTAHRPPPDEPVRLGPFQQRTRHPLYLLHLQPSPRRARVMDPGTVQITVQGDWANVWEKWSRRVAAGGQRQDFDLEVVRTAMTLRVGLPRGIELGIEVPFISLTGGVTDRTIQSWHRLLKAENGGRDGVRDGRFKYAVFMPNELDYTVDREVVMGLGDITTELSFQFLKPSRTVPGLMARLMLKLPTGAVERGLGSGDPDMAVVVHFEHGWRRFAVYANAGVIVLGREGLLKDILRPASFTFASGLELGITSGWSLVAQVHGNTTFHEGFVHRFTKLSPMALTVGTRVRIGELDLGLAMEQDILNGDPSADITMVFDAVVRVGRPRR